MSLIKIANLTFSYDTGSQNIFENATFQFDTEWKLGFIGRNGKGKTTMLNLLQGQYEYSGSISANVNFERFPFPVNDTQVAAETVISRIYPDYQLWEVEKELAELEIRQEILTRPFATLSPGERTKVMLAILFLKPHAFLLIDEPTNHLDLQGRQQVSSYLNKKDGFILVSHDRTFLDGCVDHILSINKQSIQVQRGNYSSWKQNRDYQDQFELSQQDKLRKDVKRLTEAAVQASAWSGEVEKSKFKPKAGKIPRSQQAGVDRGNIGHKAAKMMKRSKNLEKRRQDALQEKSKLLNEFETAEELKIWPLPHHSQTLVQAAELSVFYEPEKPLFTGVAFTLSQGQRLVVRGSNGSGKSSLLKLIAGEDIRYSGVFKRASGISISWLRQDLSYLGGRLADFALENSLDLNLFRAVLNRLGMDKNFWLEDIRNLSDGQKKKVALAKSLSEQANLYIWDEPLNFMDVLAREQIEELLTTYSPTMVIVEHDKLFVDRVGTDFLSL